VSFLELHRIAEYETVLLLLAGRFVFHDDL